MTSKGPETKKKAATTPAPKSAPKKGKEKVAPSADQKPQQDKAPQQQQQPQQTPQQSPQQQQPQQQQQQSQPQGQQQHQEGKRPKREKKEKETGTGVVKSVLSGDRLVIYVDGPKATGPAWRPPEEKEIKLSNLRAPLSALKNRDKAKQGKQREEEPWCWHSKDFLRKLAVGKRVEYQIDYVPATQQGGRVYGTVKLLPEKGQTDKVDLSEEVVAAGWAAIPVKDDSNSQREDRKDNRPEHLKTLLALEDEAKAKQIGIFAKDAAEEHAHVRVSKPIKIRAPSEEDESEGPLFDATRAYKELREHVVDGIVEHVHNGSMLRVLLVPSYREILLKIAGVQSPMKRKQGSDEPFARQSQYITERNILQRDVKVHLTAFEQQRKDDLRGEPTFYGEVVENGVSIGEKLLEAGMAKFVEWSAPKDKVVGLRALEESAQRTRKGLWQHEQVQQSARAGQSKTPSSFLGRVTEVSSGGTFTVVNQGTVPPTPVSVTLSSINVPRLGHGERDDDFFAWDAREFVRKKILGKKVQVTLDYVRPAVTVEEKGKKGANEKKEEKVLPPKAFYTVTHEGKNIALGLVELGYATLLEHRGQDRSPHYDALFLAQERARSKKLGLHGNKDDFIRHRIHDLSRSTQAAKRLYKSLETKEGQRHKAIVEYVISGSRLKLCLPDHSCSITFFLAGARCPGVASRKQQDEGKQVDPLAAEGRDFTNALLLHHDVEVAIDGQDKTGAFRGHLWYKKKFNLALDLLAKGLAEFSGMGKNSASKELEAKYEELEDKAKEAKLGIWKNYDPKVEEEKIEKEPEEVEAAVKPQKELISVTEILDGSHFYFHIQGEEHKRLEGLMEKLQAAGLESQPAYPPERGDVVVVRFSDGQWYRALVQSVKSNNVHVFYGDYGNMDTVSTADVRQLPAEFGLSELRWQAVEGGLAYVQTRSPEDEWGQEAAITLRDLVWGKTMLATVEYRDKGVFNLLLAPSDNSALLVNSELCRLGLAKMPRRIPRNANATIIEFIKKDQEDAHKNHRGVFEYGDDDDEEFDDRKQSGIRPGGAGGRRGK